MINSVRNEKQYEQVMSIIEGYLAKATKNGGFSSLTKEENKELKELSRIVETYEDEVLRLMPIPLTIENMVSHKMQEMNITQNKLAELLDIGNAKLSQILNGKRKPDVIFLKAIHSKLKIDGNFLLEHV